MHLISTLQELLTTIETKYDLCLGTLHQVPHIDFHNFRAKELMRYFEIIPALMWDSRKRQHQSLCLIYGTLAGKGLTSHQHPTSPVCLPHTSSAQGTTGHKSIHLTIMFHAN